MINNKIKFIYIDSNEIKVSKRTYIKTSVELLTHFWNYERESYSHALLLTFIPKQYERKGKIINNIPYLVKEFQRTLGKIKYAYAKEIYTDRASDELSGLLHVHMMIAYNSNNDDKIIIKFRDLLNALLVSGQLKRVWVSQNITNEDIPSDKSNSNESDKWKVHNLQQNCNDAKLHALYLCKYDNQKNGVIRKIITSRIEKIGKADMRIKPFIGYTSAGNSSRSTGTHYFGNPNLGKQAALGAAS